VDTRAASEAMREVGELKREVADLRGAVDVLRWEASIRDVHARIDASFATLHDKLDEWDAARRIWMLVATGCLLLTFMADLAMGAAR
jgi:hypothetical protein